MNNETCRKAFEKWAVHEELSIKRCYEIPSIYDEQITNTAWHGFEAAWNLKPKLSVEEIGNICYEKSKEWLNSDFSVRASISQSDYVAQAIYEKQEQMK